LTLLRAMRSAAPTRGGQRSASAVRLSLRQWLAQCWIAIRIEWAATFRDGKLRWAAVLVALIPSLYILIYLGGVWDPASNSRALPVGLVNLDQGAMYRGQSVQMGTELVARLRAKEQFAYLEPESEAQAQRLVRSGKLAFALVIPESFSAQSIAGRKAGEAQLKVLSSAGNHYEGALLAAQFAKALGEEINIALNTRRWALVLDETAASESTLERLVAGVGQLHQAGAQMQQGVNRLADQLSLARQSSEAFYGGVGRLSQNYAHAASEIREVEAKLPPPAEVRSVRLAAEGLSREQRELDREIVALDQLASRLQGNARGLRKELDLAQLQSAVPGSAFETLQSDAEELQRRLEGSAATRKRLLEGSVQLNDAARELALRIRDHRVKLRSLAEAMPESANSGGLVEAGGALKQAQDQVEQSLAELREKLARFAEGVDALLAAIPQPEKRIEGSAAGLAQPVAPVVELIAPVANHGSGMAPNIIPIGLWLGVGVAAFLVRARTITRGLRPFAPMPKLLAKLSVPALVAGMQALALGLVLVLVLEVKVISPLGFAASMFVAALAFLLIVVALSRIWGDAGKAFAMILLAVQMASSGGILPVELSGSFYTQISPWLPMTWVVKGLKASMFGAYEGDWATPLALIGGLAVVGLTVAAYFGRWEYLPRRQIQPALDL